ncbi:MAG: hypothetical protein H6670_08910 [Anaerolineaceae bacterium]|nr:hypothetical protein [Anaerolineaceae bacterium]
MISRQRLIFLIAIVLAVAGAMGIYLLQAQSQAIIEGVVMAGDVPVVGAVVRVRGSDDYVLTDDSGAFRLPISEADYQTAVTAWSPGYYIGGTDVSAFLDTSDTSIELHPHPIEDNSEYEFISPVLDMENPSACSHCHLDHSGDDLGALPVDEWLLDAHSGAAVNPRFLSLYNGTTVDGVEGILTRYTFSEDAGLNVPTAPSMGMDASGPGFRLDYPEQTGSCANCHVPILALDRPYQADPNYAEGTASEGVSCDFCHKIADVTLREDGLPDPGLPGVMSLTFLRPHDEQVFIGPFDDTPGDDIFSELQTESQVCAACHSGQFWDVPIYNSFGEWLASPYSDPDSGQTCQDCHMPHSGATAFVQLPDNEMAAIPERNPQTIFSHRMPGAADAELLANTATLSVDVVRGDGHLSVTVDVSNSGAGHDIPTDNPLRNMILVINATDASGNTLALLDGPTIPDWGGVGDPAEGYYAGLPGVLYAKLLADAFTGEMPTYAYWRPTRLVSDNRIAALETDSTSYVFESPEGDITIEARLILRRAFIDLMDVKGWDTPDMLMESATVTIR